MTAVPVDLGSLVHADGLTGEDEEDRALLVEMLEEARSFLRRKKWCRVIKEEYFGYGVGGIIAVFLFHIDNTASPNDEYVWVVVGDLPTAYIVTDASPTPIAAISTYVSLMQEWVDAVLDGRNLTGIYPVDAEPTAQNARDLESRLEFVRTNILTPEG